MLCSLYNLQRADIAGMYPPLGWWVLTDNYFLLFSVDGLAGRFWVADIISTPWLCCCFAIWLFCHVLLFCSSVVLHCSVDLFCYVLFYFAILLFCSAFCFILHHWLALRYRTAACFMLCCCWLWGSLLRSAG